MFFQHDQVRPKLKKGVDMKILKDQKGKAGCVGCCFAVLGIPVPVLVILFLMRGCT